MNNSFTDLLNPSVLIKLFCKNAETVFLKRK